MHPLGHHSLFGLLGFLVWLPSFVEAAPPMAADFLESPPLIRVEITEPSRLLTHPLVDRFTTQIAQSAELQRQWNRPEADPLRQVLSYAERVTNRADAEGLSELLSGRFSLAVAGPKRFVWIYELSDSAYQERIGSELATLGVRQTETPDIRKLGEMTIGLTGRWLIGSHDRNTVSAAMEKLNTIRPNQIQDAPIVNLWLDWKTLNALNKKPDRLQLPVKDAGQLIVFGNWLGMLVGTDELTVNVSETEQGFQIEILGDGDHDVPSSLFGNGAELAPLLNGPGTLWSVSGLRDWSGIWGDREALMTPKTIAAAEKANEQISQQFKALKAEFLPTELAETLGPQFRWAIARQQNLDYRINEDNSLPAAVLAISLRDAERFRKISAGPLRAINFIAAFGEAKMRAVAEDHHGVKISSLAFRDDATSIKNFDQRLFNLRPAWATTDDHFVIGTTTEIVRQTLDEIETLRSLKLDGNMVAAQAGSFAEFAKAVRDYRRTIVDESVLNNGISPDTANSEFDIMTEALEKLGTIDGRLERSTSGFRYTLTWSSSGR
ncbi:hypothetical protein [Thalassoroseus pseudoceratinae]|uniref:hypothetical protein n=1 Tax=Thalassoroseus pseudoceratinae TaxID=2713176 RepID=UPI00141DC0B9|nr:hypothetical protein [Thalassoroseus pseudoceratinae]